MTVGWRSQVITNEFFLGCLPSASVFPPKQGILDREGYSIGHTGFCNSLLEVSHHMQYIAHSHFPKFGLISQVQSSVSYKVVLNFRNQLQA